MSRVHVSLAVRGFLLGYGYGFRDVKELRRAWKQ
jgi:hypothetical protein